MLYHTIAAVSTAHGTGGIAVIRVSGDDAVGISAKCFFPAKGTLPEKPSRQAVYGFIKDAAGEIIDTGVATVFRAPASFTGEDTVEISCHGGIAVTNAVLSAVFAAGAEPAEAGEFTKRAFLNGKITLSEAESVGALISADTDNKMRLASAGARGVLSDRIKGMYDRLSDVMIALYAAIDYPDEDVGDEGERSILSVIGDVKDDALRLLSTYESGRAVAHGISAVICGKPNSGKSSVYNALSGDDRAIVTSVAGTTRDIIEDTVVLGGATLRLADTAGLRDDAADEVESIGIDRAMAKIAQAELIIAVYDSSSPLSPKEREFAASLRSLAPNSKTVAVLNKTDLDENLSSDDISLLSSSHDRIVRTSAKNRDVAELEAAVGDMYGTGNLVPSETAVIWEARHKAALSRVTELLSAAEESLSSGAPIDACCTLAESALTEIAALDGRSVTDDIIDGIFSKFCVGK